MRCVYFLTARLLLSSVVGILLLVVCPQTPSVAFAFAQTPPSLWTSPYNVSVCSTLVSRPEVFIQMQLAILGNYSIIKHAAPNLNVLPMNPIAPRYAHVKNEDLPHLTPREVYDRRGDVNISAFESLRAYLQVHGDDLCDLLMGPSTFDQYSVMTSLVERPFIINHDPLQTAPTQASGQPAHVNTYGMSQLRWEFPTLLRSFNYSNFFLLFGGYYERDKVHFDRFRSDFRTYSTQQTSSLAGLTIQGEYDASRVLEQMKDAATTQEERDALTLDNALEAVVLALNRRRWRSRVIHAYGVDGRNLSKILKKHNLENAFHFILSGEACYESDGFSSYSEGSSWALVENSICIGYSGHRKFMSNYTDFYKSVAFTEDTANLTNPDDRVASPLYRQAMAPLLKIGFTEEELLAVRNKVSIDALFALEGLLIGLKTISTHFQLNRHKTAYVPPTASLAPSYALGPKVPEAPEGNGINGTSSSILSDYVTPNYNMFPVNLVGIGSMLSTASIKWNADETIANAEFTAGTIRFRKTYRSLQCSVTRKQRREEVHRMYRSLGWGPYANVTVPPSSRLFHEQALVSSADLPHSLAYLFPNNDIGDDNDRVPLQFMVSNGDLSYGAATYTYTNSPGVDGNMIGYSSDTTQQNEPLHVYVYGQPYALNFISPDGEAQVVNPPSDAIATTYIEKRARGWIWAIVAVGIALCVLILILIVAVVVFRRDKNYFSRNAPKDAKQPIAVAFSEIESSTMLWTEYPREMGKAVTLHNQIIRQCIDTHNGFEVKTVGEAFMLTFNLASDCVACIDAIQQRLHDSNWASCDSKKTRSGDDTDEANNNMKAHNAISDFYRKLHSQHPRRSSASPGLAAHAAAAAGQPSSPHAAAAGGLFEESSDVVVSTSPIRDVVDGSVVSMQSSVSRKCAITPSQLALAALAARIGLVIKPQNYSQHQYLALPPTNNIINTKNVNVPQPQSEEAPIGIHTNMNDNKTPQNVASKKDKSMRLFGGGGMKGGVVVGRALASAGEKDPNDHHEGLRVSIGAAYGLVDIRRTIRDQDTGLTYEIPEEIDEMAQKINEDEDASDDTASIDSRYHRAQLLQKSKRDGDNTVVMYDYVGTTVNCAARLRDAACGGQILITRELLAAADVEFEAVATERGYHTAFMKLYGNNEKLRSHEDLKVDAANNDLPSQTVVNKNASISAAANPFLAGKDNEESGKRNNNNDSDNDKSILVNTQVNIRHSTLTFGTRKDLLFASHGLVRLKGLMPAEVVEMRTRKLAARVFPPLRKKLIQKGEQQRASAATRTEEEGSNVVRDEQEGADADVAYELGIDGFSSNSSSLVSSKKRFNQKWKNKGLGGSSRQSDTSAIDLIQAEGLSLFGCIWGEAAKTSSKGIASKGNKRNNKNPLALLEQCLAESDFSRDRPNLTGERHIFDALVRQAAAFNNKYHYHPSHQAFAVAVDGDAEHNHQQQQFLSRPQLVVNNNNNKDTTAAAGGAGEGENIDPHKRLSHALAAHDADLLKKVADANLQGEMEVRFGFFVIEALLSVMSRSEAADIYRALIARWQIYLRREAKHIMLSPNPQSQSQTQRNAAGDGDAVDKYDEAASVIAANDMAKNSLQAAAELLQNPVAAAHLLETLTKVLLSSKMMPAAMLKFDRMARHNFLNRESNVGGRGHPNGASQPITPRGVEAANEPPIFDTTGN